MDKSMLAPDDKRQLIFHYPPTFGSEAPFYEWKDLSQNRMAGFSVLAHLLDPWRLPLNVVRYLLHGPFGRMPWERTVRVHFRLWLTAQDTNFKSYVTRHMPLFSPYVLCGLGFVSWEVAVSNFFYA